MLRVLTIACFFALLLVVGALYDIKQRVNELRGELRQVHAQIRHTEETLHILKAEWAYLTQPAYLQHLSNTYLNLAPTHSLQLASLQDVPFPAANMEGDLLLSSLGNNQIASANVTAAQ